MLSKEVTALEQENHVLKKALKELGEKMERSAVLKPKSCQYCKHYIQHYVKDGLKYTPIYDGHCTCKVPIGKGRKRRPSPEDTCPFFELGTEDMKYL